MNAGLSNLITLKQQLLAEALRAGTKYDAQLLAIGRGVAGMFEKHCNRKFVRMENATFSCSADRDHVYLDRYPVESIDQSELKLDADTGWEVQTNFILNSNPVNGQVYWGWCPGPHYAQLRFRFTGGYWFDQTEENNDTLPDGAVALPEELRFAWLLQCRAAWQAIDKLGVDILKTGSEASPATVLGGLDLVPQVKAMIDPFRRFQLT